MADNKTQSILPTIATFEQLVGSSEEDARKEEVALARRLLQRKLASAFDSAEGQIIKHRAAIRGYFDAIRRNPRTGVETFDVNTFLVSIEQIAALENSKAAIANQYERLFGEKMPEF